jgi:VanZ family protein
VATAGAGTATARALADPAESAGPHDGRINEQRPVWSWLFFAQLALVVTASALATTGHFPVNLFQRSPFDKLGHLTLYGGLSFLAVAFFGRARRWPVVICLLVAATLEEVSQRAFPTRTFDLADLAMNVVGISVFGAAAASERWRARRLPAGQLRATPRATPAE